MDEQKTDEPVATVARRPASERRGASPVDKPPTIANVRDEDLEPHEGLRYIARLFKVLSVLLVVLLVGEVAIGIAQLGTEALPTLLVEATRLVVFAAFLWGAADIAMMLIESNHDLRAARILLGRLNGKMQRLTDIEMDELERLAANPSIARSTLKERAAARREGTDSEVI